MKKILFLLMVVGSFSFHGCRETPRTKNPQINHQQKEGALEKAGKAIDKAAQEVKDAGKTVDSVAKEIGNDDQ